MNLNKIDLVKETIKLWECTYCELIQGWPGLYTIIWRCEKYHGKISTSCKSKTKPSDKKIVELLKKELNERLNVSKLQCSAQSVAVSCLTDSLIDLIQKYKNELINIIVKNPKSIRMNSDDFETVFMVRTQSQSELFLKTLNDINQAESMIDKIRLHVYRNTMRGVK